MALTPDGRAIKTARLVAPITRIVFIAGLVAISPEPIAINGGNDAQAQPTSKVAAFFAPSLY
jgi:hypothetical protein